MITGTEPQRIIFLSEDDDSRANVGCVNGTRRAPSAINIGVFDDEGSLLETRTMDLGPWSNDQINRVFEDYAPVNGYVDVWADRDDALYTCYGSMLDNVTSDPTTILPQVPSCRHDLHPGRGARRRARGLVLHHRRRPQQRRLDRPHLRAAVAAAWRRQQRPGPQRHLLARRGIGRPLRQRARRGLRPRARPGRRAGGRGERDRPARHEPDLQHSVGDGGAGPSARGCRASRPTG